MTLCCCVEKGLLHMHETCAHIHFCFFGFCYRHFVHRDLLQVKVQVTTRKRNDYNVKYDYYSIQNVCETECGERIHKSSHANDLESSISTSPSATLCTSHIFKLNRRLRFCSTPVCDQMLFAYQALFRRGNGQSCAVLQICRREKWNGQRKLEAKLRKIP